MKEDHFVILGRDQESLHPSTEISDPVNILKLGLLGFGMQEKGRVQEDSEVFGLSI